MFIIKKKNDNHSDLEKEKIDLKIYNNIYAWVHASKRTKWKSDKITMAKILSLTIKESD